MYPRREKLLVNENSVLNHIKKGVFIKKSCLRKAKDTRKKIPEPPVNLKVGRRLTCSESSTDSEDSFIVFDDTWNDESEDVIDDDDDDTVIFQDLSGDEDDDEDEIDFSCSIAPCDGISCDSQTSRIEYANKVWNSFYSEPNIPKVTNRSAKKVSFAEGKPQVKSMVVWDYASRAARVGPWETYARDSERFRNRIHQLSAVIDPVINQPHRDKIYKERFQT